MKRAQKAIRIGRILDELYPQPDIPLGHRDPYTLLVAVVLSAQTTDRAVNKVTPDLFARAATPAAMAALSLVSLRRIIKSIGLAPTKAKNIKALSQVLVKRHDGQVPADFEALEALPGVGHKTASVVMAQAFSVPAFPVDTHIHRLAARWGLSDGSSVVKTESDLKKVFPAESWNLRHLQFIYFGRQHCPARSHDLSACAICSWAASKARIRAEALGRPTKRGKRK
jgi:endonuclease-3